MTKSSRQKVLAIVGASGHGLVVADSAERTGRWSHVEFYDDAFPEKRENPPFTIFGTIEQAAKLDPDQYDLALGIGNNRIRLGIASKLQAAGLALPAIIDPTAIISKYARIGEGSFIAPGAIINARANVGKFSIVNTQAVVEHDCSLSEATHISVNAAIGGTVVVGKCTWVGIGSCVKNNLTIGADCLIGAGSVVVTDIPDKTLAYGNPAKDQGATC